MCIFNIVSVTKFVFKAVILFLQVLFGDLFFFFLCEHLFTCIFVPPACQVPAKARRECWFP